MSCDDLDRLRTESAHSRSSGWPAEAHRHLEECPRCSQLQGAIEDSGQEDYPEALQRAIETAILPDLRPVSPLPSALRVTLAPLGCSIVAIAAGNWRLGLAGLRARTIAQVAVDFGLLAVCILVVANALARRMAPGYRRRASVWTYLAAPLLGLLAADALLFGYRSNPDFVPLALSCWEIGLVCAALSAPLFWVVLRRGFALDPVGHGASVGLLA